MGKRRVTCWPSSTKSFRRLPHFGHEAPAAETTFPAIEVSDRVIAPAELVAIVAAPFLGSFLGVVADRLPAGRSIVAPRSHCESCGTPLKPAAMIPIVSWAALGGRCATCKAPIPVHLPLIEVAALALAVIAALTRDGPSFWAAYVLLLGLLPLAFADWVHMVLPDAVLAFLALAGIAWGFLGGDIGLRDMGLGAVAGGGAFLAIAWGYRLLRRRDGLGLGDVKLMAVAGIWVGWQGLPTVALAAALLALAVESGRALVTRQGLKADSRLAFGPYLCAGLALAWLLGPLNL